MPIPITIPTVYNQLSAEISEEARCAADRIRERIAGIKTSIVEIGRDLTKVKDLLDHGAFGSWLKREVVMSQRTAERYMLAFAAFGDKSDTVSDLPDSVIHMLAAPSTPPEVKEAVLANMKAGQPPTSAAMKQLIVKAKASKAVSPAKSQKLVKKQAKAATDAVQMIVTALGADIVKFLELYSECGPWGFQEAVKTTITVEAA
jgi:hypothetical protein